ncbi:MAG: hypothetical protein BGO27_05300 [Alphaproteobacteria bacterium 33-17]|nr:MAG: hypothetical protein BGO27_05300 [Alphaproteobacteria bacterium 33-17]
MYNSYADLLQKRIDILTCYRNMSRSQKAKITYGEGIEVLMFNLIRLGNYEFIQEVLSSRFDNKEILSKIFANMQTSNYTYLEFKRNENFIDFLDAQILAAAKNDKIFAARALQYHLISRYNDNQKYEIFEGYFKRIFDELSRASGLTLKEFLEADNYYIFGHLEKRPKHFEQFYKQIAPLQLDNDKIAKTGDFYKSNNIKYALLFNKLITSVGKGEVPDELSNNYTEIGLLVRYKSLLALNDEITFSDVKLLVKFYYNFHNIFNDERITDPFVHLPREMLEKIFQSTEYKDIIRFITPQILEEVKKIASKNYFDIYEKLFNTIINNPNYKLADIKQILAPHNYTLNEFMTISQMNSEGEDISFLMYMIRKPEGIKHIKAFLDKVTDAGNNMLIKDAIEHTFTIKDENNNPVKWSFLKTVAELYKQNKESAELKELVRCISYYLSESPNRYNTKPVINNTNKALKIPVDFYIINDGDFNADITKINGHEKIDLLCQEITYFSNNYVNYPMLLNVCKSILRASVDFYERSGSYNTEYKYNSIIGKLLNATANNPELYVDFRDYILETFPLLGLYYNSSLDITTYNLRARYNPERCKAIRATRSERISEEDFRRGMTAEPDRPLLPQIDLKSSPANTANRFNGYSKGKLLANKKDHPAKREVVLFMFNENSAKRNIFSLGSALIGGLINYYKKSSIKGAVVFGLITLICTRVVGSLYTISKAHRFKASEIGLSLLDGIFLGHRLKLKKEHKSLINKETEELKPVKVTEANKSWRFNAEPKTQQNRAAGV